MIPDRVKTVLERHRLQALEFEPGSTPTSELAAAQIGCAVGQIAKSILLKAKDGSFHMIVCAGDQRIDNKKVKDLLGVKARMATAEETWEQTGFRPGEVCPFGVDTVRLFIDASLRQHETVYPAAGTAASGVPTTHAQLLEITGAENCDVTRS